MTIAIGIATRDCVVLAADSAVTHGLPVARRISSLGETSDADSGVEEGALKIISLGPHEAAAIAGTAVDATEAIAWFRPHAQTGNFIATWNRAMSSRANLDFCILVARWHNGTPELYRCVGKDAEKMRPGHAVVIGSASAQDRETMELRTRVFLVRGTNPHMIQLGVCALLIWRSFNEVGFAHNIGGAPASLLVTQGGVEWMPDTSVYAVDVRSDGGEYSFHDMIHRVSIMGRDNIVAVASTFTSQARIMSNALVEERIPEWEERWFEDVLAVANNNSVKLVALVALSQRRIALLELGLCQNKHILVQHDRVTFGDDLKRFFLQPPPSMPGGAVFSIPLGEPPSLIMAKEGGPIDDYDIDLGISFMITYCVMDKNYDDAELVWLSMLSRFPLHANVLTAGMVAFESEPGFPRMAKVIEAWEAALSESAALIPDARYVASQHPNYPEIAARLLAAVRAAESGASARE